MPSSSRRRTIGRKRRTRSKLTARTADRYDLYTKAVQSTEHEIAFARQVFRNANGRSPRVLREDFCGTFAICADWVTRHPENIAIGVDLDPEPLGWGRSRRLKDLTADQLARLHLIQGDVLSVRTRPAEVIAALNFSFCVFKRRAMMLRYMKRCLAGLVPGGVLVMDLYGGPESQKPNQDTTRFRGFSYVWDQAEYNPITNEALNHIHFHFDDGTEMRRAFTYDWRLWTPAELTELMEEAGFDGIRVYWEGSTPRGKGDGIFRPRRKAEVDDAWVAYIVGVKPRRATRG